MTQYQTIKENPLLCKVYTLYSLDTGRKYYKFYIYAINIYIYATVQKNQQILTTKGMNWEGEGFVLLTAVTITAVSPDLVKHKQQHW